MKLWNLLLLQLAAAVPQRPRRDLRQLASENAEMREKLALIVSEEIFQMVTGEVVGDGEDDRAEKSAKKKRKKNKKTNKQKGNRKLVKIDCENEKEVMKYIEELLHPNETHDDISNYVKCKKPNKKKAKKEHKKYKNNHDKEQNKLNKEDKNKYTDEFFNMISQESSKMVKE